MVDPMLLKYIRDGVRYEGLPERVQRHLSFSDWKLACAALRFAVFLHGHGVLVNILPVPCTVSHAT